MDKFDYDEAAETLSTLANALGAGFGVWGAVTVLDAYEREKEFKPVTEEYRSRIYEINVLIERLYESKAKGKIRAARFDKLLAQYEAEQNELYEEIAEMKAGVEAQKKQGLKQIMTGGSFALIAPIVESPEMMKSALDYVDKKQRKNGAKSE